MLSLTLISSRAFVFLVCVVPQRARWDRLGWANKGQVWFCWAGSVRLGSVKQGYARLRQAKPCILYPLGALFCLVLFTCNLVFCTVRVRPSQVRLALKTLDYVRRG